MTLIVRQYHERVTHSETYTIYTVQVLGGERRAAAEDTATTSDIRQFQKKLCNPPQAPLLLSFHVKDTITFSIGVHHFCDPYNYI